MDLIGPLPPSDGKQYILTVIDRFTRWPEAYVLADISARTVAKTFMEQYIPRFGCPLRITTDQGAQFNSKLFAELTTFIGTHHIKTAPYNPKANGMVERLHRQIKASLRARENTIQWSQELPLVLLGIRTAIKDDLNCSAAELVYGQNLRLPGDFSNLSSDATNYTEFIKTFREHITNLESTDTRQIKQKNIFLPKEIDKCDFILIRSNRVKASLSNPYEGPFKVIRRFKKNVIVEKEGKMCQYP